MHCDEGNFLKVAGLSIDAVAGGFEPVDGELCSNVLGGKLSAARTRPASFQQIKRQELDVRPNLSGSMEAAAGCCWQILDFGTLSFDVAEC